MSLTGSIRPPGEVPLSRTKMDNVEIVLIGFILVVWLYVIKVFLGRWGKLGFTLHHGRVSFSLSSEKISRHIPSLPIYSKEMSEKIEKEAEKLRSAQSVDYSKWSAGGPLALLRGRTNSTFLLKQPNSLEVDTSSLRKTRSEENMRQVAPRIIIGKKLISQTCHELCREPGRGEGSPASQGEVRQFWSGAGEAVGRGEQLRGDRSQSGDGRAGLASGCLADFILTSIVFSLVILIMRILCTEY